MFRVASFCLAALLLPPMISSADEVELPQIEEWMQSWGTNGLAEISFTICETRDFRVYNLDGTVRVNDPLQRCFSVLPGGYTMMTYARSDGREHRYIQNPRYHFHVQRDSKTDSYYLLDGSYRDGVDDEASDKFRVLQESLQLDSCHFGLLRDVLGHDGFAVTGLETPEGQVQLEIECVSSTMAATKGDLLTVSLQDQAPYGVIESDLKSSGGIRDMIKKSPPKKTPIGYVSHSSENEVFQNGKLAEDYRFRLELAELCTLGTDEFFLEFYKLDEDTLRKPSFFPRRLVIASLLGVTAMFIIYMRRRTSAAAENGTRNGR